MRCYVGAARAAGGGGGLRWREGRTRWPSWPCPGWRTEAHAPLSLGARPPGQAFCCRSERTELSTLCHRESHVHLNWGPRITAEGVLGLRSHRNTEGKTPEGGPGKAFGGGERALCRQHFGCALPVTSDGWTTRDSNLSDHILITCGVRLFLDTVCALPYLMLTY